MGPLNSLEDYITIMTVTHYAPRDDYGELSPPSAGILQTTAKSVFDHFDGFERCEYKLIYNAPTTESEEGRLGDGSDRYRENLQKFSDEFGIDFYTRPNTGLRDALLFALDRVETPLVMFVEHDWKFLQSVDVDSLIDTFDNHSEVNSIRFNKRTNIESGWDTIVEEDLSKEVPLCRTSAIGNHPQVTRTGILRDWVEQSLPNFFLMLKGFKYHYFGIESIVENCKACIMKYFLNRAIVRKFDDVEFVLDTMYKSDIREKGFTTAHSKWGVYLYGPRGAGPYVSHLGD